MKKVLAILLSFAVFRVSAGAHMSVANGTFVVDENESYDYVLWQDSATSERGVNITGANVTKKTAMIPAMIEGAPVKYFYNKCFQNNTVVMKVVIPDSVDEIASSSFSGCISLTTIVIPDGVREIPDRAFSGCNKLRLVTLPHGLTNIGSLAFGNCVSLAEVVLPEGLKSIGTDAFYCCSSLREIDIPETVTSLGAEVFCNCDNLTRVKLPTGLTSIPFNFFRECHKLTQVNVPTGVISIGEYAFCSCYALKDVALPESVSNVGDYSFFNVPRVVFNGKPPAGLASARVSSIVYPKEYGALWRVQLEIAMIGGYVNPNKPVVTVVSTKVRENNPTILDVVYKVTSTKPTVKVRALAFEDGERTLNKVTRPETFIDGTAANLGDAIAPNVEHKLSWQVSSDFKTDLAKMKFEVLAVEDGILPLEFITIPANGTNKKMQLSWNLLTESQLFDALLWLYADKDAGLTLANGVLKVGDAIIADSNSIKPTTKNANNNYDIYGEYYGGVYSEKWLEAPSYIFTKMGFSKLSGAELTYANEMTRLGLSPSGIRQYAWRWVEE